MRSQAIVRTANAQRYLGQFCKHFAHKAPVELSATNETGMVAFGAGTCALRADDTALTLTVTGETEQSVVALRDVVERHLVRFAFREDLTLAWQTPG